MPYGQKAGGYGRKAPRKTGVTYWDEPRDDTPKVGSIKSDAARAGDLLSEQGPFSIFGRKASDLEWRTYKNLRKLGWEDWAIQFQVDKLGGHLPGGVVLDFVVATYGMPTIIEPNGDHWHTETEQMIQRDKIRRGAIEQAWGGKPYKYIALGQGDLLTDEMAYERLLREVGRA